jgi:Putative auto-transporter adhesin, head GIN domain
MKNFLGVLGFLIVVGGAVAAFYFFGIEHGSGKIITQSRFSSSFHTVEVIGDANLYITQGFNEKVIVEAEDNVMDQITTEVRNGVLLIDTENSFGKNVWPTREIEIHVEMYDVKKLLITGEGNIIGQSKINTDTLKLHISGSGEADLDVNTALLETIISGSGKVKLQGFAETHEFEISGSGSLEADELITKKSKIHMSGSGDAFIAVIDSIEIEISDTGDVTYKGDAEITKQNIHGEGSIEKVMGSVQLPNEELMFENIDFEGLIDEFENTPAPSNEIPETGNGA